MYNLLTFKILKIMNLVIHAVSFEADSKLREFIEKKLQKLETFFDKIINVEVFLKLDSNETVKDKTVEVKVHVPGKTIFVTETSKKFEESTDLALDSVSRQIKKQKEKMRLH